MPRTPPHVYICCGHALEEHPEAVEHRITGVARRAQARLIDHRADIFVICHLCDDQAMGMVPGT